MGENSSLEAFGFGLSQCFHFWKIFSYVFFDFWVICWIFRIFPLVFSRRSFLILNDIDS